MRLTSQVEALEEQVEELSKSRDDANKQSTANGAQYMQIMAMSSRLQAQGAADAKKWKEDRSAWQNEKLALQKRIEELEHGAAAVPRSPISKEPSSLETMRGGRSPDAPDEILASDSLEVLRAEVVRLRQKLQSMNSLLDDLSSGSEKVEQVLEHFITFNKRVQRRRFERASSCGNEGAGGGGGDGGDGITRDR